MQPESRCLQVKKKIQKKWFHYGIIVLLICLAGLCYTMDRNAEPSLQWQETGKSEETVSIEETDDIIDTISVIYVYVCGEVENPGVYELPADSRVYAALELAGGFTEKADSCRVNLADNLTDGTRIYIPAIGASDAYFSEGIEENISDGLVNINTATKSQLMELPGIGAAKAEAILSYRESVGRFTCIEDIMNVSGIKEASFEQIKELIQV